MLKERINKASVRRSPFNSKRERETGKKLYHFKRKRQDKLKIKMKDLFPR
jgi:hypothetical protein